MSTKPRKKAPPRFRRYAQDRPIPPLGWAAPGVQVPTYHLGWMVRVRDIGLYCASYSGIDEYLILPNWSEHGCEPASQEDLDRRGLMSPEVHVFGLHHVFIHIACNERRSIRYLHTEAGIRKVIDQALVALGIKHDSFDHFANLLWVRWPTGEKFPELKFPCIGEHYWPDEVYEEEPGPSTGTGDPEVKLPQVAPELVYFITRRFFEKAEALRYQGPDVS